MLIRVGADTSDAEAGLNKVGRSVTQMAGSAAKGLGALGGALTLGVTTPLVALGTKALSSAAEFERTMNVLAAVTATPAQAMADLQQQALDLGADTVFNANEAAAAMLELGKAGMDAAQIGESIAGVMDLAAAGGIGLAEAANVTSAALNTFNLDASESAYVANSLAAAANASSADINDLAFGIRNAGSVFASASQNLDTLNTMMALLANNGLNASDAATSLKTMTLRLIAPTKTAAKVMDTLGIKVFDADGNMRDYRDIIVDMTEATAGMSDAQQAAAFTTVFGADAIRAANIVVAEGVAGYDEMNEAVKQQGMAAQAAEAQNRGFLGAIDRMSGSIDSLTKGVILPWLDSMSGVIDMFSGVIDAIIDLPAPIKNAALAFAGVLAAAGPIIGVLAGVAGAFALLGTAAAPILAVTAAVAGLAAAIAGGFLPIPGFVTNALTSLQTFGAELAGILATGEGIATLGPLTLTVTPDYTTIQVGDLIEGIWTPEYATIDVANIITGIWTPEYKRISIKDVFTGTWTPDFTKIEIGKAFALTLTSEGPITVKLGAEQFTFDLSAAISTMQITIAAFAGEVRAAWMTEGWNGLGALAAEKINRLMISIREALTPDVPTADILREGETRTATQIAAQNWRDQMLADMTTTVETFDFTKSALTILTKLTIALGTGDYSGMGSAVVEGIRRSFAGGTVAASIAAIGLTLANAIIPSIGPAIQGITWTISSANFAGFKTAVINAFTGINWTGLQLAATNLELAINNAFGRLLGGMITGVTGWKQPQWMADLFAWEPSTPQWITDLLTWQPTTPEWIQSLLDWSPSMPEWVESLLGWQPPEEKGPQTPGQFGGGRVHPGDLFGPFGMPKISPGSEFDFPLKAMITETKPSADLKPLQISAMVTKLDESFSPAGDALTKGAATIGSTLSGFSWPALPAWEWPALPPFTWPALPTWTWPPVPAPAWLDRLVVPRPSWLGELLSWSPTVQIRQQAITVPGAIAPPATVSAARAGEGEIGAASVGSGVTITGDVYVRSELDLEQLAYRITQLQNQRG